MLLRRSPEALRLGLFHLRSFSHTAIAYPANGAVRPLDPSRVPGGGAEARSEENIAEKERKAGRVPNIVFEQEKGQKGGNKRLISVQTKQMRKLVDHLASLSSSPGSLSSSYIFIQRLMHL